MRIPFLNVGPQGFRQTLIRFPFPVVMAVVTTGLLILTVDFDQVHEEALVRLALLSGLAFVATVLTDLLLETSRASRSLRLVGGALAVAAVVAYGFALVPADLDETRPPFWYGHFILLFALHLGIALIPLKQSAAPGIIWRFNLSLFLRFFFSSVNAAVLFGGLALALVSIDKLFGLGLDEETYFQLWFVCAFTVHPLLFLSGIPEVEALGRDQAFPKPLHFSLRFIALPLVALYLLILYAYVAKIVVQWEWPTGWVAMPIFILAVIGLLTYLLSVPLAESEPWSRIYQRWLFRLLLPLSIVLFLALQVRLTDYGLTINRYLGLALAIWLFAISLAYLLKPRLHVGWMPGSLLAVSLFAIYSGPLGAFGWSQRSQVGRVQELAAELGAWKDGQLVPTEGPVDHETAEELRSSLRYLFENFGSASLAAELARFRADPSNGKLNNKRPWSMTADVLAYLNIDSESKRFVDYRHGGPFPTASLAWQLDFYRYQRGNPSSYDLAEGKLVIDANSEARQLRISLDEASLAEIDLRPWAEEVIASSDISGERPEAPLAWAHAAGGWQFHFVLVNARIDRSAQSFDHLRLQVYYTPPGS